MQLRHSIRGSLTIGLGVILLAVVALAAITLRTISTASESMRRMAQDSLPEIQLASDFERNILFARIHFIYHVTIQKPGELSKGWENFGKVRALLLRLEAQAALPGMAAIA